MPWFSYNDTIMLANKAFCFVLKLNYLLRSLGSRSVCGFPVIARRQESGNECPVVLLWLQSNTVIHLPGDTERQYLDTSYNGPGGRFKNAYELLTLRALKISMYHKRFIVQCMGKIFCVEFQRYPLKFHTKYLTHTLKDMTFIQHWNSKSS